MRYQLRCKDCGAEGWGIGEEDSESNAVEITSEPTEWDDGKEECDHSDYEVIDYEGIYDPHDPHDDEELDDDPFEVDE